jgi:hypothetical protein
LQIKTIFVICHTADSKPVEQEVNSIVILPPLVFPAQLSFSASSYFSGKRFLQNCHLDGAASRNTSLLPRKSEIRSAPYRLFVGTGVVIFEQRTSLISVLKKKYKTVVASSAFTDKGPFTCATRQSDLKSQDAIVSSHSFLIVFKAIVVLNYFSSILGVGCPIFCTY